MTIPTFQIPTDAELDAALLKRVVADRYKPTATERRHVAETIRALRKIGALK